MRNNEEYMHDTHLGDSRCCKRSVKLSNACRKNIAEDDLVHVYVGCLISNRSRPAQSVILIGLRSFNPLAVGDTNQAPAGGCAYSESIPSRTPPAADEGIESLKRCQVGWSSRNAAAIVRSCS